MKYNVKQAVSGIQGQMDKAAQNRALAQVLGGLAGGVNAGIQTDINRQQVGNINQTLSGQMGFFQDLAKSGDKFEKLIANENLLKLGMLKANLNPSNVSSFGQTYKDLFTGGSLFEPLASIERAKIMAAGMAQREDARRQYTFDLRDAAAGKDKDPFRLFGQSSISAPFVNLMKQGGNLFDNFMQGSSGVAPDINPYIEGSLNDLGL